VLESVDACLLDNYSCAASFSIHLFVESDLLHEELAQLLPIEVLLFKFNLNFMGSRGLFLGLLDFLKEWMSESFIY